MREIQGAAGPLYREHKEEIQDAIRRIFTIFQMEEQHGLLAIENVIAQEEEFCGKHFLEVAIIEACGCRDKNVIDKLLTNRILAETDIKKQFICLLYKTGMEHLMAGESNDILREYLQSMFPEEYEEEVYQYMRQIMEEHKKILEEEKLRKRKEQFDQVHMQVPLEYQPKIQQIEAEICKRSDQEIKAILREIDNFSVAGMLLCGGDKFRERILANTSNHLRNYIMKDVIDRGQELEKHYMEEVNCIKNAIFLFQDELKEEGE